MKASKRPGFVALFVLYPNLKEKIHVNCILVYISAFFFFSFFFPFFPFFVNIFQVVIIQKTIKENLATNKKSKSIFSKKWSIHLYFLLPYWNLIRKSGDFSSFQISEIWQLETPNNTFMMPFSKNFWPQWRKFSLRKTFNKVHTEKYEASIYTICYPTRT